MAHRDAMPCMTPSGGVGMQHLPYPKEAYEYDDDVSLEAVDAIRRSVGIDFSSPEFVSIDRFGNAINA